MPYTPEQLADPTSLLFRLNAEITEERKHMTDTFSGKRIAVGEYRGSITKIEGGKIHAKSEAGVEKSFALTPFRTRQLLADTTRK